MEPIIKIDSLSVFYDLGLPSETVALQDINMNVYPEEYVVIFGPSGCGKSTLLYAIAGIEKPTSGKVYLKGQDLFSLGLKELTWFIRRNIGFVFQAYNLIPTLSVLENVALPQVFEGRYKFLRLSAAKKLLQRFGIEDKANNLPQELSGGQQQRVGITRALINQPSIILADEPVGNLDSKSAENVLEILMDLNQKDKKTIVLVTHEIRYLAFAHRVFYMRDGRIVKIVENLKRIKLIKEIQTAVTAAPEEMAASPKQEVKAQTLTAPVLALIAKRSGGYLETNEFIRLLHLPVDAGGAGLEIEQARDLSQKINTALGGGESMTPQIEEIRTKLLEDYKEPLSLPQIRKLDKLVELKIKKLITDEVFLQNISSSLARGGAGLSYQTAQEMTSKLNKVLI